MIAATLKKFLEDKNADYTVVVQPEGVSLKEFVDLQKKNGNVVAKVFVVKANAKDFMVVLPADQKLDLAKLGVLLDTEELAVEDALRTHSLFPDCEGEAIPAVGKPYNLPCLLDETILDWGNVLFQGGNRRESIQVSSTEFWRLTEAELGDFRLRGSS